MKSNFSFFVGVFSALLISWLGIVIGSNAQLGGLAPYYDDGDGQTHPEWMPGVAAQGQLVYRDLGCVACHTQQVRRPSFGSDKARDWGDRQSVARDYIYQPFPQLGLRRIGPDLTNLSAVTDRKPSPKDADDLLNMLYTGSDGMPSYKFLFETRHVGVGAQPSERALKLTGALKPRDGWEIVPTSRAESLVGYLLNLKTTYTYPEAAPFTPAKPEGEAAKPAAAPAPAAPAPAPGAAPAAGATPAPSTAPAAAAAPGAATPAPASGPSAPATPAPATGPAAGAATPAPATAPGAVAAAPSAAPAAAAPAPAAPAPGAATPAPSAAPGAATPAPSAAPAGAPAAPVPAAGTPTPAPANSGGTK